MLPFHPSAPEHFRQRNELLQKCLRPDPLPFPIDQEYPIVLAPEGSTFSYCHELQNRVCSHVNLWPRRVLDSQGNVLYRIGLIGNVATDAAWRGHGHMRNLLAAVEGEAARQGLSALVLWSDLSTFYHKLGYASSGSELRLHYLPEALPQSSNLRFKWQKVEEISDSQLQELLTLRLPTPRIIERSAGEFRRLLGIPWVDLFLAFDGPRIAAYALVGKGYDMMGVAHEWGAIEPAALLELLGYICQSLELEQTLILAPGAMSLSWKQTLAAAAVLSEELAMALIKPLDAQGFKDQNELFIWGLDSI